LFFERHDGGERAILVHMEMGQEGEREDANELKELVLSAGADPVVMIGGARSYPHPRTYVGSGKVAEISSAVSEHQAEIVIFNHTLSPGQERNLEQEFQCRVLDRTGLILDIFAQRARTHEGKLQVELAQLEHMSTRLVRGWTHLERQKGGIGLRGPGETQLETDRRLLRARITSILKRLQKVRKQREQGRRSRRRAEVPTLSLVGYTNAGKSSLFNRMTVADVYAADQLFATLDPTFRRLEITDVGPTILVDTVGFIRHLPHKLVDAFRATLQETAEASLLLHVVDASDEMRDGNIAEVNDVLQEIDALGLPTLLVYNKIDRLSDTLPRIDYNAQGKPERVWLSALTGDGSALLLQAIQELLGDDMYTGQLTLQPGQGQMRAQMYSHNAVQHEKIDDIGNMVLDIRLPKKEFLQILNRLGMDPEPFVGKPKQPWEH
jgi:GTP-binding protein HflX